MKIQFQYPEDRVFFANLLTEGDAEKLDQESSDLFDFRHPAIKRWEFDKVRKVILQDLLKKHGNECQLKLHPECSNDEGFELDHIIPLSSNILNKELRGQTGILGLKVLSQSFGSNSTKNLTLSCKKCNGLKKHKFLPGSAIQKLLNK